MTVTYTRGGGSTEAALEAIRRAEESERPVLLVLDDADDAGRDVLDHAAALIGDSAGRRLLLVVLHARPEPHPAFAAQAAWSLELGPLEDDAIAEIVGLYLPTAVEPPPIQALAVESRGLPLAVHRVAAEWARALASRAAEASAGRAATERDELRAAEAELSGDLLALRTVDEQGRLYGGEEDRAPSAGGLPLPRPRHLRRSLCGVLLRSRAARSGAGRPARGLAAACCRRTLGKREVVCGACRPAAGAGGRSAARLRRLGGRR